MASGSLGCAGVLASYVARDLSEEHARLRLLALAESEADPWSRSLPLHLTASAIVVHPASARILLRWHERLSQWMQVGGHGDTGEDDPLQIAVREAEEETGLPDLRVHRAGPGDRQGQLVQMAVVPVPPRAGEPAHEHGDLRYILVTDLPELARPESPAAQLRWLTFNEALDEIASANLRELLVRTAAAFGF